MTCVVQSAERVEDDSVDREPRDDEGGESLPDEGVAGSRDDLPESSIVPHHEDGLVSGVAHDVPGGGGMQAAVDVARDVRPQ